MKLYSYFKPNDIAYTIYATPNRKTIEKIIKCDVCNGIGKFENKFTCGKCYGKGKIEKYDYVDCEDNFNCFEKEILCVKSYFKKDGSYNEHLIARFTDVYNHRVADKLYSGYGNAHSPDIDTLYKNKNDLNKLKNNIPIIKKRSFIKESKFNIGQTVFAANLNYTKILKCDVCNGVGSIEIKKYTHYCNDCKGKGEKEVDVKEYSCYKGTINEISMHQNHEGIIIFYTISNGVYNMSFSESIVASTENELDNNNILKDYNKIERDV